MDSRTGHLQRREDIIIRQYHHPDDLVHIRRLFVDATMTGRGSPYQRGMATYNVSRILYPAIGSLTFLRIVPWLFALHDDVLRLIFWTQTAIGVLCLVALISTLYQRRQIRRLFQIYLDESLAGELVDVVKYYNLHVTENGACIAPGLDGFWVAESGGEFAGCVGLSQDLQIDSTVGGVRRLFVAPTHQSKGVARKLMATLTSHALDHKLHVLELTTSKYNQTALHFYQKLGWKITGQTNYHGFTLVVLRLKLSVGPR